MIYACIYIILGSEAQPSIRVAPRNTADVPGNMATLFCSWDNTGGGNVQWFNHTGSGSGEIISNGDQILGDASKYGLSGNHGSGEYNLQIKSLTDADVGDYACFTQLNIVRYGAYVLLVGKSTDKITV